MKKLLAIILAAVLTLSFTACGGDSSSSTEDNSEPTVVSTPQPDNNNKSEKFSSSKVFAGHNIYYPESVDKPSRTDYGYYFGHNGCLAFFEAPATTGVMTETNTIDEAIEFGKTYIYKSIEEWKHSLFDVDKTELVVGSKENKTFNGIEMCRVTGKLKNTADNTEYDFAGYFTIVGIDAKFPMYIWGIELPDATADVADIIDEMASRITLAE